MNEQKRNEIISRWQPAPRSGRSPAIWGWRGTPSARSWSRCRPSGPAMPPSPSPHGGPPARSVTSRHSGTAGPLPRPDRQAALGGVAAAGLHRRLHRGPAAACASCAPDVACPRWSASRRRRGSRPRWITPSTTSTSPSEGRRRVHPFSYVLGYSRRQYLRFVEAQDFATTLREHMRAFAHLGGVAATCLYDNMKVVVTGYEDDVPLYNPRFLAFATHYGFRPVPAGPAAPRPREKWSGRLHMSNQACSTAAASRRSIISTR